MLITMLTAMYMMVRVVESIGLQFAQEKDPLPYMVSQPLPWQVHSVSHSRRSSKVDELRWGLLNVTFFAGTLMFEGLRRNSIGVYRKSSNSSNGTCVGPVVPPLSPIEVEKAAATIQTHFRKFQHKKHKNSK